MKTSEEFEWDGRGLYDLKRNFWVERTEAEAEAEIKEIVYNIKLIHSPLQCRDKCRRQSDFLLPKKGKEKEK